MVTPSGDGGATVSSAASIISRVMLVNTPVMRLACRSSFRAVCRPIKPPSWASITTAVESLAIDDFSLSSSSRSDLKSTAKLSGSTMPFDRATSM